MGLGFSFLHLVSWEAALSLPSLVLSQRSGIGGARHPALPLADEL